MFLVVAAATENYDESENDDPGAVIIEKMAKTVVVHRYVPPKNVCDGCTAHLHNMSDARSLLQK